MSHQTELAMATQDDDHSSEAAAPRRSFEETLGELEEHVRRLDSGELPLEDALTLFEHGVGLVRECTELLDQAERRIVELSEGPEGVVERPFDGGARGED